jgi:hydrogenase maturation protease
VVKRLQQDEVLCHSKGLTFLCLDRPGVQLLHHMQNQGHVIIVDAVAGQGDKGSLVRLQGHETLALEGRVSSHDLGLASALQLGSSLDQLPPNLVVLGLETEGDAQWQWGQDELTHLLEAVKTEIDSTLSR